MFCTKCGSLLKENARFCTKCGAPVRTVPTPQPEPKVIIPKPEPQVIIPQPEPKVVVSQPEPQVVVSQPEPQIEESKQTVEEPVEQPQQIKQEQKPDDSKPQPASSDTKPEIFKFRAPKVNGEAVLGELKHKASRAVSGSASGPGEVLTSGFKQFFTNILAFFKNPKVMIPSILVALIYPIIWMILNILQANGINPWPLKFLSFLTCANGGMSGGIFGGFGGIIGKGVFIAGIVTLIGLLFRKKGSTKRSFGEILKGSFGVSRDTLGVYFTGIGIALLFYLFLTGGATRISCLCGIAAMIIAARAALNNGFRARILNSLTSKVKNATGQAGAGLMRGFTVGYAASAILGLITGTRIIPVILAIHFLIAGAVFIILQLVGVIKPKKAVN